jgi:single-strand DNA-binding protein
MIKVTIIGRLTADPELSNASGTNICKMNLASSTKYKNEEKTSFLRVTSFGPQAETVNRFFKKGDQIIVFGEGSQNKFTDKNGVQRESFEVRMESFTFGAKKQFTPPEQTAPQQDNYNMAPDFADIPF